MNNLTLYNKSCFDMSELADNSIQCIVTSPPYWGLRKYKAPDLIFGGNNHHEHEWTFAPPRRSRHAADVKNPNSIQAGSLGTQYDDVGTNICSICGAWKGQYGLEPDIGSYVQHTIEWLREARRVLRPDGVCFVNCGDSYYASGGAHKPHHANPGLSKSAQRDGVPRVWQNGRRGKELSGLSVCDSASENLCGECVKIWSLRNAGKNGYPSLIPQPLSAESIHSHKVSEPDRQGNSHLTSLGDHSEGEIQGLDCVSNSLASASPASRESTSPLSSAQSQDGCLQMGDWLSSPDVRASLFLVSQGCEHTKACPFFSQMIGHDIPESAGNYSRNQRNDLIGGSSDSRIAGKAYDFSAYPYSTMTPHLKAKDLCLIPFRVAIAAQEDGWYVRSAIVWNKPNPMPESVTDRPTDAYEFIFLFTKSARYYWDAEAVRQPYVRLWDESNGGSIVTGRQVEAGGSMGDMSSHPNGYPLPTNGANLKNVWTFPTQPYPEAHFATFPEELPERCIKAATPEYGCCDKCGRPYERITEHKNMVIERTEWGENAGNRTASSGTMISPPETKTLGWKQVCKCENSEPVPSTVLDPFAGSGTTLYTARKMGRIAYGYEISSEYCKLIEKRNCQGVL